MLQQGEVDDRIGQLAVSIPVEYELSPECMAGAERLGMEFVHQEVARNSLDDDCVERLRKELQPDVAEAIIRVLERLVSKDYRIYIFRKAGTVEAAQAEAVPEGLFSVAYQPQERKRGKGIPAGLNTDLIAAMCIAQNLGADDVSVATTDLASKSQLRRAYRERHRGDLDTALRRLEVYRPLLRFGRGERARLDCFLDAWQGPEVSLISEEECRWVVEELLGQLSFRRFRVSRLRKALPYDEWCKHADLTVTAGFINLGESDEVPFSDLQRLYCSYLENMGATAQQLEAAGSGLTQKLFTLYAARPLDRAVAGLMQKYCSNERLESRELLGLREMPDPSPTAYDTADRDLFLEIWGIVKGYRLYHGGSSPNMTQAGLLVSDPKIHEAKQPGGAFRKRLSEELHAEPTCLGISTPSTERADRIIELDTAVAEYFEETGGDPENRDDWPIYEDIAPRMESFQALLHPAESLQKWMGNWLIKRNIRTKRERDTRAFIQARLEEIRAAVARYFEDTGSSPESEDDWPDCYEVAARMETLRSHRDAGIVLRRWLYNRAIEYSDLSIRARFKPEAERNLPPSGPEGPSTASAGDEGGPKPLEGSPASLLRVATSIASTEYKSVGELADAVEGDIAESTARDDLMTLWRAGLLDRRGTGRSARYRIKPASELPRSRLEIAQSYLNYLFDETNPDTTGNATTFRSGRGRNTLIAGLYSIVRPSGLIQEIDQATPERTFVVADPLFSLFWGEEGIGIGVAIPDPQSEGYAAVERERTLPLISGAVRMGYDGASELLGLVARGNAVFLRASALSHPERHGGEISNDPNSIHWDRSREELVLSSIWHENAHLRLDRLDPALNRRVLNAILTNEDEDLQNVCAGIQREDGYPVGTLENTAETLISILTEVREEDRVRAMIRVAMQEDHELVAVVGRIWQESKPSLEAVAEAVRQADGLSDYAEAPTYTERIVAVQEALQAGGLGLAEALSGDIVIHTEIDKDGAERVYKDDALAARDVLDERHLKAKSKLYTIVVNRHPEKTTKAQQQSLEEQVALLRERRKMKIKIEYADNPDEPTYVFRCEKKERGAMKIIGQTRINLQAHRHALDRTLAVLHLGLAASAVPQDLKRRGPYNQLIEFINTQYMLLDLIGRELISEHASAEEIVDILHNRLITIILPPVKKHDFQKDWEFEAQLQALEEFA